MRKAVAPSVASTTVTIPDHWKTKVSVGQVMTIGEYPNQKRYEILYVCLAEKYVRVKPLK